MIVASCAPPGMWPGCAPPRQFPLVAPRNLAYSVAYSWQESSRSAASTNVSTQLMGSSQPPPPTLAAGTGAAAVDAAAGVEVVATDGTAGAKGWPITPPPGTGVDLTAGEEAAGVLVNVPPQKAHA
eukprot:CAMPEP_0181226022 /NCGR_PEP_ID=MMETSP1096-20121128/32028_1 /TAXON_ID=156174 ORGANISM="Chrysochromulina ericina, Strain CCMP281" /NCGR_SAMPLE_ID=MMETSP1096 /ASSEMBLY_ACC=CAM_ASM_000453 /LENGTH=125 /DNA_ID=CAMNT_0023319323 /DNA_START=508 /DNA_END=884 /DNA_ORIENTATION=-